MTARACRTRGPAQHAERIRMRWFPAHATGQPLKTDAAAYAYLCLSPYGSEPEEQAAKRQGQMVQEAWEEMWMPWAVPVAQTRLREQGPLASAASADRVAPWCETSWQAWPDQQR